MHFTNKTKLLPVALLLAAAPAAYAQSSVTIYGVLDVYTAYQKSTVGGKNTSLWAMGNNGEMTSRLGFKGSEDLGGGYRATFNLENGFDPSTGGQQNNYRLFDRQSWVGLGGGFGEVRVGRQNTPMFLYAGNMDAFGAATYGSAYNNFANWLARVDNDISYISPKFANSNLELHYSVGERAGSVASNSVYQIGAQTQQGPVYVGSAYLNAKNGTNTNSVKQFMLGGNVDYGSGKIYLAFFRTNEVVSATTGNVFVNPAGKYDPTGNLLTTAIGNYHNTYSLSADYRINASTTIGAGGGYVKDSSSYNNNARQFSLIVNYDLSKRTRLYAVASRLVNQNTAAYKMTGASFTASQALSPDAGASETGVQFGIRHTF
ncbi:porin [Herbaspirillum sp. WKF16]|uniref:porin n=1 Tax=Herbaspirillum sp. WKF16 TaxID=3028312 RepID=UPI0023A9F157|nr:porin [Herbaspirillum sp. WKF16]WDZ95160.1 porin [Herbaspirillum sp. WKF16]